MSRANRRSTRPEPPALDESARPPRRIAWSRRVFELVLGLGVLLISVVSLFVAVSANRTQERMLAASVWPSLQFGTSNVATDGSAQVTFDLLNRGIGPARIRWAEVLYKDQPMRTFAELLATCCQPAGDVDSVTSGLQRRVLGSDEWINIVRVPKSGNDEALWQQLDRERQSVRLHVCYCSVLDACWLFDSRMEDPVEVKVCPAAPAVLWGD